MRGRKPKPTKLRQLAGNPGKRKFNQLEPKPAGDLFDAPAWLTETQADGWRYAIANAPIGMLRRIDRSVLTIWCVAEDLHRQAAEQQAKTGQLLVKASKNPESMPIQSPYLPIINKQAAVMLKAAEQLGFSPAARPRIAAGASPAPVHIEHDEIADAGQPSEDYGAYLAGRPTLN